jgi:hypothetical protein
MGRVHLAPIPSPVNVTRATYRRDSNSAQADVFATATPSIGAPKPVLSVTGTNVLGTVMTNSGAQYFAQPALQDPHSIPASLLTTNSSDTPVSFTETDLVDEVQITGAIYDPSSHELTVRATSGDQLMPPTLLAIGIGTLDSSGQLVAQLPVPPAKVTVVSSWGGRDTRKVSIASAVRNGNAPFAENDTLGDIPADQAIIINILSNDTPNSGVVPRILAQPLHGTAIVNANDTVTYTPAAAYAGPDSFSYVNTDGTSTDSNVATVSFNVAFVNHAPIANPDTVTASVTMPVVIDVLANDTDPDASDHLDPQTVTIVTLPASGAAVPNANGTITFVPAVGSSGTITFAYTVKDTHGAVSNPATVSVSLLPADTITIITAQFRTRGDWRVRGTNSIAGPGNTITIHNGPTLNGPVIGTIAVDVAGAWDFTLKGTNLRPDGTNTISVESTKGGRRLAVPLQITN